MTRSFKAKNSRRIHLIEKKHGAGLTAEEQAELAGLQHEVSEHVRKVAPRSTEIIDEIARHIEELKERVLEKRK